MAMAPERNARISDPQWRDVVEWIKEMNFPVKVLPDGILAFETEEDITMFMLRWA